VCVGQWQVAGKGVTIDMDGKKTRENVTTNAKGREMCEQ